MEIIPAVDVLGGKVVRLMEGSYDEVTEYGADPVARALSWMDAGARLVHVVDLEGARSGRPSPELWSRLASAEVRFQVGGGIRTPADARSALEAGAERVVMGTAAIWQPETLTELTDAMASLVAAVDVRDGRATGSGWMDEGRDLDSVLDDLRRAGVRRILVTGIGSDGTMQGPEMDLLSLVVDRREFAVIASGGVGTLDDLVAVADLGCEASIVGRALYEGRFSLKEAIEVSRRAV